MRYIKTELEPVTVTTINGDKIELEGKKSYCKTCEDEIYIEEDRLYNLEKAIHVLEKGEKYKD
jgi:hypothetical protein